MGLFVSALLAALPLPSLAQPHDYEAQVLAETVEVTRAEGGNGIESLVLPLSSGSGTDGELAFHCRPAEEPWINLLVDRDRRFPGNEPLDARLEQSHVDVTTEGITLGSFLFMWGPADDPRSTAMLKVHGQRTVLAVLRALQEDSIVNLDLSGQDPRPFGTAALTLPEDQQVCDQLAAMSAACGAP